MVGRIGGNVFHRGPYGNQIRAWSIKRKSKTVPQRKVRNAFTQAMNAWKEHTWTPTEISLWKSWCKRHPYQSKIGMSIILTHYQAFIRYNWYRFYNSLPPQFTPPVD